MKGLTFVASLFLATSAWSQDLSIDDYLVRWHVMAAGNTEIRIMKTAERTYINVYRTNGLVSVAARMPGPDAVEVGTVLARTQEFFQAQQETEDNVAEKIEAGNFTVTFRTSVFSGFTVVIQENSRNSTNAVTLSREEAMAIQPELLRANEYIEYLDSKVDFQSEPLR